VTSGRVSQSTVHRARIFTEIDTHLEFAYRLEYATPDAIREVRDVMDVVAALLARLIESLRRTGNRR